MTGVCQPRPPAPHRVLVPGIGGHRATSFATEGHAPSGWCVEEGDPMVEYHGLRGALVPRLSAVEAVPGRTADRLRLDRHRRTPGAAALGRELNGGSQIIPTIVFPNATTFGPRSRSVVAPRFPRFRLQLRSADRISLGAIEADACLYALAPDRSSCSTARVISPKRPGPRHHGRRLDRSRRHGVSLVRVGIPLPTC